MVEDGADEKHNFYYYHNFTCQDESSINRTSWYLNNHTQNESIKILMNGVWADNHVTRRLINIQPNLTRDKNIDIFSSVLTNFQTLASNRIKPHNGAIISYPFAKI